MVDIVAWGYAICHALKDLELAGESVSDASLSQSRNRNDILG